MSRPDPIRWWRTMFAHRKTYAACETAMAFLRDGTPLRDLSPAERTARLELFYAIHSVRRLSLNEREEWNALTYPNVGCLTCQAAPGCCTCAEAGRDAEGA